jgi:PKD repeat protein
MTSWTWRAASAVSLISLLAACSGIPANPASPSSVGSAPAAPRLIQVVIDPGLLPFGGGTALIRLEVLGVDGSGVRGATVGLSVTGGTLEAERAVTDASGHAKVVWTGTNTAMLTATLGEITTDTMISVDVPAPAPPPVSPPPPAPAPAPIPPGPQPAPPQGSQLLVLLAAAPEQALEGESVTFTATPRGLENENVSSYEWDFDGNGTTDETTSAGTRAHVYPTPGVKNARVTIRTTAGNVAVGTRPVTIGIGPATMSVVLASSPSSVPAGSPISFNAIVSTSAAAGTPAYYSWEWDTSAAGTPTVTTAATTAHTYQTAGARTARVTVTSSTGMTASSTASVDVTPAPTTAAVTLRATPQSTIPDEPILFTATVTTTGSPGKVLSYEWDWDISEATTPLETTSDASVSHKYPTTGNRTVRVTVTYESGLTAAGSTTVAVTAPPATP